MAEIAFIQYKPSGKIEEGHVTHTNLGQFSPDQYANVGPHAQADAQKLVSNGEFVGGSIDTKGKFVADAVEAKPKAKAKK